MSPTRVIPASSMAVVEVPAAEELGVARRRG